MKKTSTIGTVLVLCIGFQPANAGLLGMPLNLKAVMAQAELDGSASVAVLRYPSCQFYTDDVLIGPVLVSGC
jgi:hypothetical protein